jgi:hypothetical protein
LKTKRDDRELKLGRPDTRGRSSLQSSIVTHQRSTTARVAKDRERAGRRSGTRVVLRMGPDNECAWDRTCCAGERSPGSAVSSRLRDAQLSLSMLRVNLRHDWDRQDPSDHNSLSLVPHTLCGKHQPTDSAPRPTALQVISPRLGSPHEPARRRP